DATSIALAGLRFHYHHLAEVRQSLSWSLFWLLAADCSSAFSLACKILALQSYVDVRSDARPALEAAQAKLAVLVQEPAQIAKTPAWHCQFWRSAVVRTPLLWRWQHEAVSEPKTVRREPASQHGSPLRPEDANLRSYRGLPQASIAGGDPSRGPYSRSLEEK